MISAFRRAMEQAHQQMLASPEWLRTIYYRNACTDARLRGRPAPPPERYGLNTSVTRSVRTT